MTRHVIALTGYAGVGKDTVANLLTEHHNYVRLAYADKIKHLLYGINPVITGDCGTDEIRLSDVIAEGEAWFDDWDRAKRFFAEVRSLLQVTGEAVKDLIGPSVWVDPVMESMKQHDYVVIPDMRFPQELRALRLAEGCGLIDRLHVLRLVREGVGPASEHVSENIILPVDEVLHLTEYTLDRLREFFAGLVRLAAM